MEIPNKYYIENQPSFQDILMSQINSIYETENEPLTLDRYTVCDHEVIFDYQNYTSYDIRDELLTSKFITIYLKDYDMIYNKTVSSKTINGPFLVVGYSRYDYITLKGKRFRGFFILRSYNDPHTVVYIPFKLSRDINNKGIISHIYSCDAFDINIRPLKRYTRVKNVADVNSYYDNFIFRASETPMVIIQDDYKLYNLNYIIKDKFKMSIRYNPFTNTIKFKSNDSYIDNRHCKNHSNLILYDYWSMYSGDDTLSHPVYYNKETKITYVPIDFFSEILNLDVIINKDDNTVTIYFNK